MSAEAAEVLGIDASVQLPINAGASGFELEAPAPSAGTGLVRQLFGGDTRYLIGFALQMAMGSIVTPILTRVLGSSSYGRVAAAIAVMQVLVTLEGLGLATGIQRAVAVAGERAGRAVLSLSFVASALFSAVLLVSLRFWAAPLGFAAARDVLAATIVWAGLSSCTACSMALLRSFERLGAFNLVNLTQTLVAQAVGITIALESSDKLLGYLYGIVGAQAVAALIAWRSTRPVITFWRDATVWSIVVFSLPLLPQQLASFVLNASDRLVIQRDLGAVPVGRYQIAYSLAGVAILIVALLGQTWFPSLLKHRDAPDFTTVLAASRDKLGYMLIPAVLGLCAGLPELMRFWVPARYSPSGLTTVIVLVSLSAIPFALSTIAYCSLVTAGATLGISWATVAAAGLNLVLNLALVPVLGIDGSAWATLIAYGALGFTTAWLARRSRYRVEPNHRLTVALVATAVLGALSPRLGLLGGAGLVRWCAVGLAVVVLLRMLLFASGRNVVAGGGGVGLLERVPPAPDPDATDSRPVRDRRRRRGVGSNGVLLGLVAVSLGVAAAFSVASRAPASPVLVAAFLFIGVGTVPLQWRRQPGASLAHLVDIGPTFALALAVAGGFGIVALHWWHPYVLAAVLGAAAGLVHAWRIAVPDFADALLADLLTLRDWLVRPQVLISLAGLATCVATGAVQYPMTPGRLGMFSSLDWPWWIGFALCAGAVAWGLRRARRDDSTSSDLALPVLVLVSIVSLTTAVVYSEPRFEWVAKHVGVTEYILQHHSVNSGIDIYQAWPGLFSATAWFTTVAHLGDPFAVARWWPPVIDVATALVLRRLAAKFTDNGGVAWLAAVLFGLALAFGQDYFSPQALGLVFAIAVLSLAVGPPRRPFEIGMLALVSVGLAVSHQLSPYPVFGALVILVLFRLVRPFWIPLLEIAPALLWAAAHWAAWKQYVAGGFFDFFSNTGLVSTTGQVYPPEPIVHVANYTLGAGCAAVGLMALIRLITRRDRLSLALALCALSPIAILFGTSYGGEADNRVVFFAMPWCALLAADWCFTARLRRVLPEALTVLLSATSFVAVTGLDWGYVDTPAAVAAERWVEAHAPANSMIISAGSSDATPASLGARYPDFAFYSLADLTILPQMEDRYGAAETATLTAEDLPKVRQSSAYYIVATSTLAHFDELKGIASQRNYDAFVQALDTSPSWRLVFQQGGARVWERVP